MSHSEFINNKTGEVKTRIEYLIANFKTSAKEFKDNILQHWRSLLTTEKLSLIM